MDGTILGRVYTHGIGSDGNVLVVVLWVCVCGCRVRRVLQRADLDRGDQVKAAFVLGAEPPAGPSPRLRVSPGPAVADHSY